MSLGRTAADFQQAAMAQIITLTAATALLHLYLGFQGFPLFVLNGLGYLALPAAP